MHYWKLYWLFVIRTIKSLYYVFVATSVDKMIYKVNELGRFCTTYTRSGDTILWLTKISHFHETFQIRPESQIMLILISIRITAWSCFIRHRSRAIWHYKRSIYVHHMSNTIFQLAKCLHDRDILRCSFVCLIFVVVFVVFVVVVIVVFVVVVFVFVVFI